MSGVIAAVAARLRFAGNQASGRGRFWRGTAVPVVAEFHDPLTGAAVTPGGVAWAAFRPDGTELALGAGAGSGATRGVLVPAAQTGQWVVVLSTTAPSAEVARIVFDVEAAEPGVADDLQPAWVTADGAVVFPSGAPVTVARIDLLPALGAPQDTDLLPAVRGAAGGTFTVADFRDLLGGGGAVSSVAGRTGDVTLAVADVADAVPDSRGISAGAGLSGGGDLSADRTIDLSAGTIASLALADSAVQPARSVSAGTGLSGGGDLSADRTLSLSAGAVASLALADSAVQPADLVAASRVIWVDPAGDDAAAGDLPTAPKRTVTAALAAAVPGDVIRLRSGTYTEPCPMVVPRDVAVVGDGLRVVTVRPTAGTAGNTMWLVDSGAYLTGMTFAGHQAGAWAVAFHAAADNTALGASGTGAFILKSPYIQNCTSYTAQDDGGLAGSTSDGTTGGGLLVDGAACAPNSPIRSMVVDSYTQINLDGPGCLVTNDAYAQLVSFFGTFCSYHVKALNGGQVNLSNSTTDFGTYGLVADGRSTTPIFTGEAAAAAAGANQITVTALGANRLGTSNRPASGMVFDVDGNTYTVIGAAPTAGGFVVTFYPVLAGALAGGEAVEVFLRSQIATGGHVMEFVGAGTNYLALPWNGGVPIPANEIVEQNGGRVFFSTTDQLGNFRVGPQFDVNGTTGAVTINTDQFNLSGLNFIGPFSRDGGFSSVGVQLQEVSNSTSLLASTGAADGNTVPTQFAVVSYLTANYTPLARSLTAGTGLSGGGDLSANRTFDLSAGTIASLALADSAVQPARSVSAGTGLSGGGDLSADRTIGLADTAVTPGSYGSASAVATITVDAQGRLTAAGTASITPGGIGAAEAVHAHVVADIMDFAEAVEDRVGALLVAGSNITLSYDDAAGALTIASVPPGSGAGSGTVTSVDVSGGSTGLTTSGGPVTASGTITLAGTLAVAHGGTGGTDAAGARAALGLAIGTDVQAWDADLGAIAALAGTSGLLRKTDTNTWSLETASYLTGNQTITVSGDATGSGSTSIALTLADSGVAAGTWRSVTVDAKGRVTAGTNPTTLSGYGITDAAALGANTFSGAQNLADNELVRPLIKDYAEVATAPTISSNVLTLDLEAGNVFDVALDADITTLTISNPPASGRAGSLTLILTADGTARAVTWGAAVKWPGAVAPTLTSESGKKDIIVMTTLDGGTTWLAIVAGQAF